MSWYFQVRNDVDNVVEVALLGKCVFHCYFSKMFIIKMPNTSPWWISYFQVSTQGKYMFYKHLGYRFVKLEAFFKV